MRPVGGGGQFIIVGCRFAWEHLGIQLSLGGLNKGLQPVNDTPGHTHSSNRRKPGGLDSGLDMALTRGAEYEVNAEKENKKQTEYRCRP